MRLIVEIIAIVAILAAKKAISVASWPTVFVGQQKPSGCGNHGGAIAITIMNNALMRKRERKGDIREPAMAVTSQTTA